MAPRSPHTGKNKVPFNHKGNGKSPFGTPSSARPSSHINPGGGSTSATHNIQYGPGHITEPSSPTTIQPKPPAKTPYQIPRKANPVVKILEKGKKLALILPRIAQPLSKAFPVLTKGALLLPRIGSPIGIGLIVAGIVLPLWWENSKLKKPKIVKPKQQPAEPPPFTGGQFFGVQYKVYLRLEGQSYTPGMFNTPVVVGRIDGIKYNNLAVYLQTTDINGVVGKIELASGIRLVIHHIERIDGQPDTGGNINPFNPLLTSNPQIQSRPNSPWRTYLPGGANFNPTPSSASSPPEANKRDPLRIAIPANRPITVTTSPGNAVTVAPSKDERIITTPRPLPPQITPDGVEPDYDLPPLPLTITAPGDNPIILTAPGSGPVTISVPGSEPYTFNSTSPNQPLPISTIKPIGKPQPIGEPQPIGGPQPSTLFPNPTPITAPTTTPATTPTTTPTTTPSPTALN